jgi:hypothetical protein
VDDSVCEHVDKKLRQSNTPGKGDAVFLLRFNGDIVGSCFAIDETHVLSARHNMYEDTADFVANDTAEVLNASTVASPTSTVVPAPITVKISACLNPPCGGKIFDYDDWIVLERTDGEKFRIAIAVQPTVGTELIARRPFVTIYHFPISLQKVVKFSNHLHSNPNRVIGAENGELRCNDFSLISMGSCGGPYVDNLSGVAIGFHIAGASSFEGKAYKKIVDAINNVPVGLHFGTASTLVLALRTLNILR